MKKILILTDFSENAWNAISYIIAFYSKKPVTYVLAHIITSDNLPPMLETQHSYASGEMLNSNFVSNQLALVKKKMLASSSNLSAHEIEVVHLESNFTLGIKKIAFDYTVDLIVMGSRGKSETKNKIIGSHTDAVITKVKYPLLIIPEATVYKKPLNVVFPTDYNFIFKPKILNTLSSIITLHASNLSVLRVVNSKLSLSSYQQTNRTYLKDFFKDSSVGFYKVKQPELAIGIQSFIDTMEIDMIAMIAKNLNFFQKLLFNQRVVKMSYHLKIPFLILHE